MKKRLFIITVILFSAIFAFSGCTSLQAEVRMRFDEVNAGLTGDKLSDYIACSTDDAVEAKAGMTALYTMAHTVKTAVLNANGVENGGKILQQSMVFLTSSQESDDDKPVFAPDTFYMESVEIKPLMLDFKATANNDEKTEITVDTKVIITVTGKATDKDGNILKGSDKKDITYNSIVMVPNLFPLHEYKISEDSAAMPVLHIVYTMEKTDGKWLISTMKDGDLPLFDLTSMLG